MPAVLEGRVGVVEKAGRAERHPAPQLSRSWEERGVQASCTAAQSPAWRSSGDAGITRISIHRAPAPSAASPSFPGRPGGSGAQVGCAMSGAG